MNNKPTSSKSRKSTTSNEKNVSLKLRRLKIEENLLLQSLQKLDKKDAHEGTEYLESEMVYDTDFKKLLKKLKDSYINIRNLFDDVRTVTSSKELLAGYEIDEIKKKVLQLETDLKSFKSFLNSELNSLKLAEQELIKQIDETNVKESITNKRRSKIVSANYKQIVPSPVKLLMTSPFKCPEVQEFQKFLNNSPNRYGGWNEYYHNIFVKYWQKYFGNASNTSNNSEVENLIFENFIEEVLFKLQGVKKESLMSHIEWYKQYLLLKDNQQKAIDKWKSKRLLIKKVPVQVKNFGQEKATSNQNGSADSNDLDDYNQIVCDFISLTNNGKHKHGAFQKVPNDERKIKSFDMGTKQIKHDMIKSTRRRIEQEDIQRLMRPTKQWLSKNFDDGQKILQPIGYIESLEKLRIPNWRLCL